MIDLLVGDVFRHRITGQVLLVGDLNEVGGVCDDCRHDLVRDEDAAKSWELIGNLRFELEALGQGPMEEKH